MEDALEKFHINLEETRNKITYHAQLNFPTESNLHECQHLLSIIYQDVQRLFDIIPLPNEYDNEKTERTNNDDVWIAMVENCKMKASQLAKELCLYVTSTSSSSLSSSSSQSNSNDNHSASHSIRTTLIDHHNGMTSQTAIAQIVELTQRIIIEAHTSILNDDDDNNDDKKHNQKGSSSSNKNHNNNIHHTNIKIKKELLEIKQRYVSYQRALLRCRSKPSIENIAQIRKFAKQSQLFVSEYIHQTNVHSNNNNHNDDDDDDENQHQQSNNEMDQEEYNRYHNQPYAHAITVILGEASSLLHPLMMWLNGIQDIIVSQFNHETNENMKCHIDEYKEKEYIIQSSLMEMCIDIIDILHLEAERLTVTIGNWLIQDHQESFEQQSNNNNNDNSGGILDLSILDNSLDEMAYVCQVIHRYCIFTHHISQHLEEEIIKPNNDTTSSSEKLQSIKTKREKLQQYASDITLSQHLKEQSLFYSTTETKLTNANLHQALKIAKPVEMILGMEIYVPSIVDDAYFISTRALERASGTLESKAIWTIAHWVVDIWSVSENHTNGNQRGDKGSSKDPTKSYSIYQALLDSKGCTVNEEEMKNQKANGNNLGNEKSENTQSVTNVNKMKVFSFSSALIDALDGAATSSGNHQRVKAPLSGPLSGSSLLSNKPSVDVHKIQMDTEFCNLNGFQAAAAACIGLAEHFNNLISAEDDTKVPLDNQTMSMINLAKEQMESHSKSYKDLLHHHAQQVLIEWCGSIDDTHDPPPLVASLRQSPCLERFFFYISNEEYNLVTSEFYKAESDDRLEKVLMNPFNDSRLLLQVKRGKCDEGVTLVIMQELSRQVVSIILGSILNQKKQFSEWGSLLLSKQIRMLERYFCSIVLNDDNDPSMIGASGGDTSQILNEFQKVKQAATILQLDKPSDWTAFANETNSGNSLSPDEIRNVMKLRHDWSIDNILAIYPEEQK